MDNNQHWRGGNRGRGRGGRGGSNRNDGFGNNNNAYNNDYNSSGSNISITARLGPTNNPMNDRIVQPAQSQQQYSNNYNNDNQRGGGGRGRAFNNYNRGSNRGGRGGPRLGNPQFSREFMDEDVSIATVGEIIITVTGYPPQSEEKVLGFLTRKSKTPWEPLNIATEGTTMQITVANEQIAESLCHMNDWNFGASTLKIIKGGSIPSNGTFAGGGNRGPSYDNRSNRGPQEGRNNKVIIDYLMEHWTEELGYLDMDALPETSHNVGQVISRLLDQAKQLFGDRLITLSFARNKLWSVSPLTKAAELFPNLTNLSVADNEIAEFRSLDKLRQKFPALQELMLYGNPIQQNNDAQKYQTEVLKRFPTIQFLDQQQVQGTSTLPPVVMGRSISLPMPTRSNFFDQESSRHAAQDLLSKFFPLFDTNRGALVDLYDTQAIFSVVFVEGTFQQQKVWGSSQEPPVQRMILGNENIVKRFISLPHTMHDLSSANNFVTDAWQTIISSTQQVLLNLVVHGEFAQVPDGANLSFDRTFIVAPAVPGSRALAAGWSYVILNDSLVVRDFSCKPAQLVNA